MSLESSFFLCRAFSAQKNGAFKRQLQLLAGRLNWVYKIILLHLCCTYFAGRLDTHILQGYDLVRLALKNLKLRVWISIKVSHKYLYRCTWVWLRCYMQRVFVHRWFYRKDSFTTTYHWIFLTLLFSILVT